MFMKDVMGGRERKRSCPIIRQNPNNCQAGLKKVPGFEVGALCGVNNCTVGRRKDMCSCLCRGSNLDYVVSFASEAP